MIYIKYVATVILYTVATENTIHVTKLKHYVWNSDKYMYIYDNTITYNTKFWREKLWRIWGITSNSPKVSCPNFTS